MKEIDIDQEHYSEQDLTRCKQLDRVSRLFKTGMIRTALDPQYHQRWAYLDSDGCFQEIVINARFLYGVFMIRNTLINELSATGHKETAADIVGKYERNR